MESVLKERLGVDELKSFGRGGGGCISTGQGFSCELGNIFVKYNKSDESQTMFKGEEESLKAIGATNAIKCPKPIGTFDLGKYGSCLVTDYIDMGGSGRRDVLRQFGTQLAEMHIHNANLINKEKAREGFVGGLQEPSDINSSATASDIESASPVTQFGFHVTTCCGRLPMVNEWSSSWPEFFMQHRIKAQVDRILAHRNDHELHSAFPLLVRASEQLFAGFEDTVPGIVHGDLWSGNWAINTDGEPVIFDPSSFYADPEFEEGIMNMFGGFGPQVWASYHKVVPKRPGREQRVLLYELFHHLNHWNHFGTSYRGGSLSLIQQITRNI